MASRFTAERALEKYEEKLIELPNVVGLTVASDTGDENAADHAVVVLVANQLDEAVRRIPQFLELDAATRVPVRVVEIGTLRPESSGRTDRHLGGRGERQAATISRSRSV